jgi:HPt (histidine-containing phosphotransfer) domain-containing protein
MAVSRAFLREFLDESERHLGTVEGAVRAISGQPFREEPLHQAFRAIHAFTGGACFLGLERPHRLARALESALDAFRVRTLPCDPEQAGPLLDALARLRVLLTAQRGEGAVPGDDEAQITALRTAVNVALAQSDDYRPSTSTVVRLIKAEIAPASDVFPPDEPGKPALEPRIVTSARFHQPALAAIDRLVATLPGDWHEIGKQLRELGRHAAGWPTAACDRLVAMRRFGDRLETGHPEAAEAYAQLVLQAEALRAVLAPPGPGAPAAAAPPPAGPGDSAGDLDPDTMSFCREATDLLGAIESVVNKPGQFDDEGIEAVVHAFRALGETAARLRMPWVESVARRLERDLAERHGSASTSPATQRVLATAGVDALRVLIRRVRGQGRGAGRR